MASDTRDRILAAAARLYASPETGGPALRAIAREAGVNSALIHYHFGSRDGLFEAVLLRALGPVQARRGALIEGLRVGGSADGRDLARVCVDPLLTPGDRDGPGFEADLRLLARASAEHRERLDRLTVKHFAPMLFGLRDALASALPALAPGIKQRRFRFAADQALATAAGHEAALARAEGRAALEALGRELTAFLAGALEAPS